MKAYEIDGKMNFIVGEVEREGLVFKCNEIPELSVKAISNGYLLRQK